jgi:hypothetical protein
METQFRAIIPAAAAPRRGGARAACAYRHLRESIASGRLAPRGVYRRAGIATELGVSRVPVKRRSNDLDLIFISCSRTPAPDDACTHCTPASSRKPMTCAT